MKQHDYTYKEYISKVLPVVTYGIVCGAITGVTIFFFRYAASLLEGLSRKIYGEARGSAMLTALLFCGLALMGIAMAVLHKYMPRVSGGGIPRSEGILRGTLTMRWIRTIIGTLIGSFLSFLGGLPLGSEGPAVLMGTATGRMCTRVSKNPYAWDRYVMTGGAGAGFAVATGAPLSAILFTLEEIHKRFSPMLILSVSSAVVSASCVNSFLSGVFGISKELFDFVIPSSFEFGDGGYLLLFGVIISACVGLFNLAIAVFGKVMDKAKKRLPTWVIFAGLFVITGAFGLFFDDAIFNGHKAVEDLALHGESAAYIGTLLLCRLFFMLAVTSSGATGGIFVPTLAIGALCGGLGGKLLIALGMSEELFPALVFLGMCAFLGGTLRAPLTAAVLFFETTASFTNMFYVTIVIFTVYILTEFLGQKPFYDKVLEGMEEMQNKDKVAKIIRFETKISHGSFVVGKAVRDVLWPASSVVTSITRAGAETRDMDHDGEKKLYPGDTIVLRVKTYDEEEIRRELAGLVGSDFEITAVAV